MQSNILKVMLKGGEPTYNRKVVEIPELCFALLKGKGEGGVIYLYEHLIKT